MWARRAYTSGGAHLLRIPRAAPLLLVTICTCTLVPRHSLRRCISARQMLQIVFLHRLNSVSDPDPVKQEVQRVIVTSSAPRDETQRLLFTNVDSDTTSIRLYVSGTWTSTSLTPADSNSVWSSAIETALGCSGCVDVVGNAGYSSSNKTISFLGTGSVDLLAVDEESIVRRKHGGTCSAWSARTTCPRRLYPG